jgi:3-hydroxypropanoate dehydrogenase
MGTPLSDEGLDVIFRAARTHRAWLERAVPEELLRAVWELAKLGPTSSNTVPVRVVFVKSREGKEKLRPALAAANVDKTMAAPATAIVAYDLRFYEFMGKLSPRAAGLAAMFKDPANAEMTKTHAFRNGTLGGAYLMIAARALGLDCGPMSGFDNAKVDGAFFGDGRWKSNFLCNLGYGDATKLHPREERLTFEEACRVE